MRQSADLHGQFDDYSCQKWDYVVHKQLRWGASLRARRRAVAGLNARFTTFAAGSGLPRPTSLAQLFVNQTIPVRSRKWVASKIMIGSRMAATAAWRFTLCGTEWHYI